MELNNVSRTYLMGEVKVQALFPVNLEIYQGELLVILGPSGSGKSTMLNILGGMDTPDTGCAIFRGLDLAQANDHILTEYRRREVGFVFQFYNLIPDLTARENVELAANLVESPLPAERVLEQFGLGDRIDHFPSQMSGGEQQRVSIARALVKNPKLLLCDEPTGALDFETGKNVLSLLKMVNQEWDTTVVIVTHNTPLADMADRVIKMRSGNIIDIIKNPVPLNPELIEW
ncbi:MAG TPA: ABC transporter ATP-binding protein [Syntrophomonadaceae bacterium]|jgi:putative ABC transport system ATP-binding protein|nr:ABC transporter ATP-binding protein [Syntrophomonadaceae bacterium]HRX21496.1 ABC transporter ATP-binding protein [Syntrophomonadaceae bacterium]